MIKLHEGKKLILNDEVIASVEEHPEINPEDAKKETLTYRVLKAHNQSEDMENLLIKFDEMGVLSYTPISSNLIRRYGKPSD